MKAKIIFLMVLVSVVATLAIFGPRPHRNGIKVVSQMRIPMNYDSYHDDAWLPKKENCPAPDVKSFPDGGVGIQDVQIEIVQLSYSAAEGETALKILKDNGYRPISIREANLLYFYSPAFCHDNFPVTLLFQSSTGKTEQGIYSCEDTELPEGYLHVKAKSNDDCHNWYYYWKKDGTPIIHNYAVVCVK